MGITDFQNYIPNIQPLITCLRIGMHGYIRTCMYIHTSLFIHETGCINLNHIIAHLILTSPHTPSITLIDNQLSVGVTWRTWSVHQPAPFLVGYRG